MRKGVGRAFRKNALCGILSQLAEDSQFRTIRDVSEHLLESHAHDWHIDRRSLARNHPGFLLSDTQSMILSSSACCREISHTVGALFLFFEPEVVLSMS
jgi:hypothetical protein